jgi:hypothetical protein
VPRGPLSPESEEDTPPTVSDFRLETPARVKARIEAALAALAKDDDEAAVEHLALLSGDWAIAALLEVLAEEAEGPEVVALAVRALVRNGSAEALDPVLDSVRISDDRSLLAAVSSSLSELERLRAPAPLLEACFDGTDDRLGGACSAAVARLPAGREWAPVLEAYRKRSSKAVALLAAKARETEDERVARAAATALLEFPTEAGARALIGLAAQKDRACAGPAASALAGMVSDNPESGEVVGAAMAGLGSASPRARLACARALTPLAGTAKVKKRLEEARRNEADADVKAALDSALGRRPR